MSKSSIQLFSLVHGMMDCCHFLLYTSLCFPPFPCLAYVIFMSRKRKLPPQKAHNKTLSWVLRYTWPPVLAATNKTSKSEGPGFSCPTARNSFDRCGELVPTLTTSASWMHQVPCCKRQRGKARGAGDGADEYILQVSEITIEPVLHAAGTAGQACFLWTPACWSSRCLWLDA